MIADQTAPMTIDEYIAGFPQDVQEKLEKIRMTNRDAGYALSILKAVSTSWSGKNWSAKN